MNKLKILQPLAFIITLMFLTSCRSFDSGILMPSAILNQPNFRIVKSVSGHSRSEYFFGIGGFDRYGQINEAKQNLYQNANLTANQTIANVTNERKVSWIFFPIYYSMEIIITADIIEYGDFKNGSSANNVDKGNAVLPEKKISSKEENNEKKFPEEEKIILKLMNSSDSEITLSNYQSVNDVVIDDYVKCNNNYNQKVYGRVVGKVSNNQVSVRIFPSPGSAIIYEYHYKELMKVKIP